MKVTFLGATDTVTGSKYLLEAEGQKIMVDCGLFQGLKELRLRNWAHLPVDPKELDALLLTHAHLDHSGYIPRLVKAGFAGPVYCTYATADLCEILLPDSGHIQEEDAARANRYGYTKHSPAKPLYTEKEAMQALKQFKPQAFSQRHPLTDTLEFSLHTAGHILGAAMVHVQQKNGPSILFSGDLGRLNDPVMKPPATIEEADYIVVESTYGDRRHDATDPIDELGGIIQETIARGGTVVIPSFAVGRAQEIMYYLYQLKAMGQLPANLPVFLDSPMAIDASELLKKHMPEHRLSAELCSDMCRIATYTQSAEDSKAIYEENDYMPKVIISASGMATGGRILHHLKHYVGNPKHTIIFAGYQAAGTRGDRLTRGEKEIKIHGQMWPVKAQIEKLDNLSAHADYAEILTWLEGFRRPPKKVFVTHGEPAAAQSMRHKIKAKFGWDVIVPEYQQEVQLS